MRLEAYLVESQYDTKGRTKKLEFDDAVKTVYSKCMKSWKNWDTNREGLFRGNVSLDSTFAYVEPSKFNRKSANTTNHYTLILDNMKKWKKFPDRSKSIVCSNHWHGSYGGNKYLVLPFDGSRIGKASTPDLWGSFEKTLKMDLDTFNIYLDRGYKEIMNKPLKVDSYQQLMKDLDAMWNKFLTLSEIQKGKIMAHNKVFHYMHGEGGYTGFDEYFNDVFDPARAGFDLMKAGDKYGTVGGAGSNKRECWTDGNCVLIDLTMIDYGDVGKREDSIYLNFKDAVNA